MYFQPLFNNVEIFSYSYSVCKINLGSNKKVIVVTGSADRFVKSCIACCIRLGNEGKQCRATINESPKHSNPTFQGPVVQSPISANPGLAV